jgi:hypothetical protein
MKQKSNNNVLSFVGGVIIFSVLIGIVMSKNERLRREVETQLQGLLTTSGHLIRQLQRAVRNSEWLSRSFSRNEEPSDEHEDDYQFDPSESRDPWMGIEQNLRQKKQYTEIH